MTRRPAAGKLAAELPDATTMPANIRPEPASPWPLAVLAKAIVGVSAGLFAVAVAQLLPAGSVYPLVLAEVCILVGAVCDAMLPGWLWADGPAGSRVRAAALRAALSWYPVAILGPLALYSALGPGLAPLYLMPVLSAGVAGFGAAWAHRHDAGFDGQRPTLRLSAAVALGGWALVGAVILSLWHLGGTDRALPMWSEVAAGVSIVAAPGLAHDVLSARHAARAGHRMPAGAVMLGRAGAAFAALLLLPSLILLP